MKKGFTLIELLVVVLIIGILAAIALPQYQKAVMKSHLVQWAVYINSIDKAMQSWILANGVPIEGTRFSGNGSYSDGYAQGALDVDIPCLREEGNYCYTKFGRFNMACDSLHCFIDVSTSYNDYAGPFSKGTLIWTSKFFDGSYNGERVLSKVDGDDKGKQVICEWWKNNFGLDKMTDRALENCGYSAS